MSLVWAAPARAYGTGGWKDCEPVCDALVDGRRRQLALQREMMGGGEAEEEASARERARLAERARARAARGTDGGGEKR